MTFSKADAIARIKDIQSGSPPPRYDNQRLLAIRSEIARSYWNDAVFTYGMEYGHIQALMDAFDITVEDLGFTPGVLNMEESFTTDSLPFQNAHAMDCDSGAGPDAHTISYSPQFVLKPLPYSQEEMEFLVAEMRSKRLSNPHGELSEQDKIVSRNFLFGSVWSRLGALPTEDEIRADVLRVLAGADTLSLQIEVLARTYGANAVWAAREIANGPLSTSAMWVYSW